MCCLLLPAGLSLAVAQPLNDSNSDTLDLPASVSSSASTQPKNVTEPETDQQIEHPDEAEAAQPDCSFYGDSEDWIDGMRKSTHSGLCKSVVWLDGLFGDEYQFNDEEFKGKLSIGFRDDSDEGFDPRVRVRIKARLPNVSNRFSAFLGRVEEDSYISNTEVNRDRVNAVGLRSADNDEAEWLVGLGYRNPNKWANGFDYSVGAKLSSGISPYVKVAHRHLFPTSEDKYWRTTQTLFWRKKDGYGFSSNLDYTRLLSDRDIAEWNTQLKYTEETEQWEWITGATWHHSFSKKTGISSRAYVRGETENSVKIPEYGLTFTYVRPFLRPWLLIEAGVDFRWEKLANYQSYQSETRFGLQFEMLLGDYYNRNKTSSD